MVNLAEEDVVLLTAIAGGEPSRRRSASGAPATKRDGGRGVQPEPDHRGAAPIASRAPGTTAGAGAGAGAAAAAAGGARAGARAGARD